MSLGGPKIRKRRHITDSSESNASSFGSGFAPAPVATAASTFALDEIPSEPVNKPETKTVPNIKPPDIKPAPPSKQVVINTETKQDTTDQPSIKKRKRITKAKTDEQIQYSTTESFDSTRSTNLDLSDLAHVHTTLTTMPSINFDDAPGSAFNLNTVKRKTRLYSSSDASLCMLAGDDADYLLQTDSISVKDLDNADMKKFYDGHKVKSMREDFQISMQNKLDNYQKNDKSTGVNHYSMEFSTGVKTVIAQMVTAANSIKSNATELIQFAKSFDYDSLPDQDSLLNEEFYQIDGNVDDIYTKTVNDSYNQILGAKAELSVETLRDDLELNYIAIPHKAFLTPINDISKEMRECLEKTRKRISQTQSIVDITTKEGITLMSKIVAFIEDGYRENDINLLFKAVIQEVRSHQLSSAFENNLVSQLNLLVCQPRQSGLHSAVSAAVRQLLPRCALSALVSTIRQTAPILEKFYYTNCAMSDRSISAAAVGVLEEVEVASFAGSLADLKMPNMITFTPETITARVAQVMRGYGRAVRDTQMAAERPGERERAHVAQTARLVMGALAFNGSGFTPFDALWAPIAAAAAAPKPHPRYPEFAAVAEDTRRLLKGSAQKTAIIVAECFNRGLAQFVLPFLFDMQPQPAVIGAPREVIKISHFLAPLKEQPFKITPEDLTLY